MRGPLHVRGTTGVKLFFSHFYKYASLHVAIGGTFEAHKNGPASNALLAPHGGTGSWGDEAKDQQGSMPRVQWVSPKYRNI